MKLDHYKQFFTAEHLMGPNSLLLLEELLTVAAQPVSGMTLDLGCGTAVTSLMLARETAADKVFATDLWISASDNWQRVQAWNQAGKIVPIRADANNLPYAEGFFQSIVSVDAYHYFGCEKGFFAKKILPLLAPKGQVLLVMPGIKREEAQDLPLMQAWAGDEKRLFHSAAWWEKNIMQGAEEIRVKAYKSQRFDQAWADWFATGHDYALRDKTFLDQGLRDELCFVMLEISK